MQHRINTSYRTHRAYASCLASRYRKAKLSLPAGNQQGYALLTLVILLMIVGVMAAGAMNISNTSEHLASNSIQHNRAFHAADAATYYAEAEIETLLQKRIFANDSASKGLYTFKNRPNKWWQTEVEAGVHKAPVMAVMGVIKPPKYSIEQVGDYVSDGGTGVVNLDIGGAAYGRITAGGREILLFNVQSHGNGSFNEVKTVVETAVAFSY